LRRREFCKLVGLATAANAYASVPKGLGIGETAVAKGSRNERLMLDMVHISPGEPPPQTAFLDPRTLSRYGYNGQVVLSLIEGVPNFDSLSPTLLPPGSSERTWSDRIAAHIEKQIDAAHAQGLQCFAWMQMIVFPAAVVQAYKAEICDAEGHIDVELPATQKLLRIQLAEIFDRLPKLDGLLIRTGEVYLHDLPYHASTSAIHQTKMQGGSAILHGEKSHLALLTILREEICLKRGRYVIYRTWDFGDHFHNNPAYYLRVTDAIVPHPKLLFSVKHQKGDFLRLTPFNPNLMIGKHRQIVEVQCQLEVYGKGSHPYYNGDGVINGWEEMAHMMKPGEPRGLRDIIHHPLYGGTWTWSRGGGWGGPYITNEMWCAMNAYVISKFSENPARTEPEILASYARSIGLRGSDISKFREMQLLTAKGVLRGQLTALPASIDLWWTRDDRLGDPNLSDFARQGLVQAAVDEKAEACQIWDRIAEIAIQIRWRDAATSEFVASSVAYGRFKYEVIRHGWSVLFLGREGDKTGSYDRKSIGDSLRSYDTTWAQWKGLKEKSDLCATLYKDIAFGDLPGLGAAVDEYRHV
jgi:hypothetical protein